MWYGREACSISGCLDSQSGIMTHAMLLAVGQLKSMLRYGYSVADLYNMILEQDKLFFKSERDILLQCPPSFFLTELHGPSSPHVFMRHPTSGTVRRVQQLTTRQQQLFLALKTTMIMLSMRQIQRLPTRGWSLLILWMMMLIMMIRESEDNHKGICV